VLDRLSWVLVVFLFLEVILLQVLNHLLPPLSKLTVELYHGHILNHQIISPCISIFLPTLPRCSGLLTLINSRINHCHLFRLLIHLKLLPKYVPLDLTLLPREHVPSKILISATQKVMLVNHSKYGWNIRMNVTARIQTTVS
jgi:hypothetical protein